MITTTGQSVWPSRDMRYESSALSDSAVSGGAPSLFDIGTGLSRTVRFAGQTRHWYSVLQHALTVASLLPDHLRIYGLLHDAAESVVGDQVTTWKNHLTRSDEDEILERICLSIGVQWPWPNDVVDQVRWADLAALRAEALVLEHGEPYGDFFVNHCPFVPAAISMTSRHLKGGPEYWTAYGYGGARYEAEVNGALLAARGYNNSDGGLAQGV